MFVLAGKSIKQIVRDWKSFTFLLLMPVLFTFFLGSVFQNLDEEDRAEAERFMEAFGSAVPAGREGTDLPDVIGEVYTETLAEGGFDFGPGLQREEILQTASAVAAEQLKTADVRIDVNKLGGAERVRDVPEAASGFQQSSPGMMIQFTIMGLITSAMVFLLERKSKTLGRLISTPVRYSGIVGGQILAMFLVVFIQQNILVFIGALVFHVPYFRSIPALYALLLLFSLWATGYGVMISTITSKEEQVVTICIISMFLFSIFGGAWFPLEIAGSTFSAIGRVLPTAWVMDGFHNIILRGLGISSLWRAALILTGYTAVFFAVSLWRFRSFKISL